VAWTHYWGLVFLLTLGFGLCYALAFSFSQGLLENFRRHWQKSELQWTGPGPKQTRKRLKLSWLLLLSFLTAWVLVEWLIAA
jgi:hypothetical protein